MKKYLWTTFLLLTIFVSLLLATFLLSDSKITSNVSKSLVDYNFLDNKKYDLNIDNYTDMIILNIITYNHKNSIIKRAFGSEYGILYVEQYGEKEIYWNQYENLKASLNFENDDSIFYGRYWYGCLTIIKPLLRFFTYQQSLVLLAVIGLITIIISGILVLEKLNWKYLIAYTLSLISLNIYIFSTCYQYFFTIIPMIIFNIVILLKYKHDNFNSNLYFYIFGAIAAYIMNISFPLITLCYPLLIFTCLEFENNKSINYKENIILILKNSVMWLIGYVLFYLLKWLIGTILVGTNFIEDALMSVSQRLGITFSFSYLDVLNLNLTNFFNKKINIILLIIALIFIIIKMRKNLLSKLKIVSPILIIGIMPFVWMFVCNNHSAVHYWMISRLFSISIFALLIISIIDFKEQNYQKLEKLNINDFALFLIIILFFILYKFNIIFIIICICMLILVKLDKRVKVFITLLIILSSFLLISTNLNKKDFNNKEFFQNIYIELYHKAITYGKEYADKNQIYKKTKVDIKDLIETINSDSVFLLSCKGYVIIENGEVEPYINCNDVMVTEGYSE